MSRYIDAEQIRYRYLPIPAIGDLFVTKLDIQKIQTADVENVRHGRWIKNERYVYDSEDNPVAKIGEDFTCSECGRVSLREEPYCHCGAKMLFSEDLY